MLGKKKKMPKYFIKGGAEVSLSDRDFVAKGGEGSIFAKGNTAYKIYEDPNKMIPPAKISELSVINNPNVIKPESIIMDSKNKCVGYTMKLVKNTHTLCELFTKAFKKRNNIDTKDLLELIKKFQKMIKDIHDNKILVVDLNELNFLTNDKMNEVYAIDVNSYQTQNFPATAIMDTIRDRHAKQFSELTDWFSWGIITFQLLTGIHPFKGKCDKFDQYPMDQRIDQRMLHNVSVFNPDVRIPATAENPDIIPQALRSWYKAIFESDHRSIPPFNFETMVQVIQKVQAIVGSDLFNLNLLQEFDESIINYFYNLRDQIVITQNSIIFNKRKINLAIPNAKVLFTPKRNTPVAAYEESGNLKLINLSNGNQLPINLTIDGLILSNNNLYAKMNTNIVKIDLNEINDNITPMTKLVGKVLDLPEATKMFDGIIIQNLLGRYVASLLDGQNCYQIKFPELDDHKILNAKYENKVLVTLSAKRDGTYHRYIFKIDNNQTYTLRKEENVSINELNFTVADQGICLLLNEDEKFEIFSNKANAASLKIVEDKKIQGDIKLFHKESTMLMALDNKLYSVKMK